MKITLGIGALGIGLIAGFAPQASAQSRPAVRLDQAQNITIVRNR